ncbi:hypothetical protein U1Q18_026908 [Sarracenia purpurea var. burkii]
MTDLYWFDINTSTIKRTGLASAAPDHSETAKKEAFDYEVAGNRAGPSFKAAKHNQKERVTKHTSTTVASCYRKAATATYTATNITNKGGPKTKHPGKAGSNIDPTSFAATVQPCACFSSRVQPATAAEHNPLTLLPTHRGAEPTVLLLSSPKRIPCTHHCKKTQCHCTSTAAKRPPLLHTPRRGLHSHYKANGYSKSQWRHIKHTTSPLHKMAETATSIAACHHCM